MNNEDKLNAFLDEISNVFVQYDPTTEEGKDAGIEALDKIGLGITELLTGSAPEDTD